MSHLDKSGSTGVTVVGLFSRVNAGVGLQVGWSVELGTAHIAAIRLLSCRGHNKHISCCDYTHGHNHLLLYESHCPKRCTLKHSKHLCMLCGYLFACAGQFQCIHLHNVNTRQLVMMKCLPLTSLVIMILNVSIL